MWNDPYAVPPPTGGGLGMPPGGGLGMPPGGVPGLPMPPGTGLGMPPTGGGLGMPPGTGLGMPGVAMDVPPPMGSSFAGGYPGGGGPLPHTMGGGGPPPHTMGGGEYVQVTETVVHHSGPPTGGASLHPYATGGVPHPSPGDYVSSQGGGPPPSGWSQPKPQGTTHGYNVGDRYADHHQYHGSSGHSGGPAGSFSDYSTASAVSHGASSRYVSDRYGGADAGSHYTHGGGRGGGASGGSAAVGGGRYAAEDSSARPTASPHQGWDTQHHQGPPGGPGPGRGGGARGRGTTSSYGGGGGHLQAGGPPGHKHTGGAASGGSPSAYHSAHNDPQRPGHGTPSAVSHTAASPSGTYGQGSSGGYKYGASGTGSTQARMGDAAFASGRSGTPSGPHHTPSAPAGPGAYTPGAGRGSAPPREAPLPAATRPAATPPAPAPGARSIVSSPQGRTPPPEALSGTSGRPGPASKGASLVNQGRLVTTKGEGDSRHAFSTEETRSFAEHINDVLKGDKELASLLPINPNSMDLFEAVKNGVLLCKLINWALPGTVEHKDITPSPSNLWESHQNHVAAINGARKLGCTVVSIGSSDLREGKPHLVLGLLWQIIKIGLLKNINVHQHPEMIALLRSGEHMDHFVNLPPEETLLRWFNYHLSKAGSSRSVSNFSRDVADSEAYITLLHRLRPDVCGMDHMREPDLRARAALMLRDAGTLGCDKFVKPTDVVSGNEKLNLAFTANLFNHYVNIEQDDRDAEERTRLLAQAEEAFRKKMEQEEAALRARWEAEEAEFRQRLAEEEAMLKEQRSRDQEEHLARLAAQEQQLRDKLDREEKDRAAAWAREEEERRRRWEREEADRRARFEQEDRARRDEEARIRFEREETQRRQEEERRRRLAEQQRKEEEQRARAMWEAEQKARQEQARREDQARRASQFAAEEQAKRVWAAKQQAKEQWRREQEARAKWEAQQAQLRKQQGAMMSQTTTVTTTHSVEHVADKKKPSKVFFTVVEARNLPRPSKLGKPDPFVVITFKGRRLQTRKEKSTCSPVWNQTFELDFLKEGEEIAVAIFDRDRWSKNTCLGQVVLKKEDVADGKNEWFVLKARPDTADKVKGDIRLSFMFG